MKTRRILALIMTVAMLFSMMGPSLAMAEEQLILDGIEIAAQPESNADSLDLDDPADLSLEDPLALDESAGLGLDGLGEGELVTGLIGEDTPHTVTFDARGGQPQPEPQTVVDGGFAQLPEAAPTLEGYVFTGWYLDDVNYFADDLVLVPLSRTAF